MKNNDYYSIAINDMRYMQCAINSELYNQIAIDAQQVAEKALKSVLERVAVDVENELKSHNLKIIFSKIPEDEGLELSVKDLSYLKDFYFEARYPGDDYIDVTKEMCNECLSIMYTTLREVNAWRIKNGFQIAPVKEKYCETAVSQAKKIDIDTKDVKNANKKSTTHNLR